MLLALGPAAAPALAGAAEEVSALPTLDALNRTETPLSNNGKWTALGWSSGNFSGRDTATGWGPYDAFPTVNGAYWNPSAFSDAKAGSAAAITMQTNPGNAERYVSLWLDMPSPGSAKSGYQLRWTMNSDLSTYTVKLSRWASGVETVLASNASVSVPNGTTMAISDTGGTVTVWKGTGGSLSSLLSAADSTYGNGYAGIEAAGSNSRSTDFKAGALIGGAIGDAPILDDLGRQEVPLANGKWTKATWAATIGGSWYPTWHGYGTSAGGPSAAYWNSATFGDGGSGAMVAATVGTGSTPTGQYVSLWLDMPSPGSERSGYEARFSGNGSSTNYKVELSKWVAGTRTVLATKEGFSLPVNTTIALTDTGGNLVLWTGTGSSFSSVLTTADSTYGGGYAGLEVVGGAGTYYNFKAAGGQPPDTTLTGGSAGTVTPDVAFSFNSPDSGATFGCSLDGAAYSACTSPKSYQGLTAGWHTFRVRAVSGAGTDATPAERMVKAIAPHGALYETPLLDNFERYEVPLATGNWGKATWATVIGGAWAGSWHGYGTDAAGNLSTAYWKNGTFNDGKSAEMVAATVGTGSTPAGQYVGLWLNMPNPTSIRSGYEIRFTGIGSGSTYKAELSKWVSGTRTILTSKEGVSLPVNTTFAMTYTGGSLTVWTGNTSSLSPLMQAVDTTYNSGYVGIEVLGGAGTYYNSKGGQIAGPPQTTIASGPSGQVAPQDVSFTFTGTNSEDTFECSLDNAAYAVCTSPKAYPGLANGPHTFKVRAIDFMGVKDATPAERSFEVAQAPTVATAAATAVESTQASLNATINPNGVATTYQFEYGTTTSYGSKVPVTVESAGSGTSTIEVSEPVSDLAPDTTYHFRISATNAAGTKQGEDESFTTIAAPTATTEAAEDVKANEATLKASINPQGAETSYYFEYGPTTSYGSKIPVSAKSAGSGTASVEVSEQLTGLTEGQIYHYRVVATNDAGTTYGADKSIEIPYLPEAKTEAGETIDANEAILSGTVDPKGKDTTYKFEYGTTTAYGTVWTSSEEAGDANAPTEFIEPIAHLEPETTYHYRIVASSEAGTDFGADKTFTTEPRVFSAQREQEEREEEILFTGKFTGPVETSSGPFSGPVDGGFPGVMTSTNGSLMNKDGVLNAIKQSGAKWLRLQMRPEFTATPAGAARMDEIFIKAANRGIRILPYLEMGWPTDSTEMKEHIQELVQKYGPGGSAWSNPSVNNPMPAHVWEIGNEPNRGDTGMPDRRVHPAEFGDLFAEVAGAARAVNPNLTILLAGLYSAPVTRNESEPGPQDDCVASNTCVMTIRQFLQEMGHQNAYDAISIHPYLQKVDGAAPDCQVPGQSAPDCDRDKRVVINRLYGYVVEAREKLRDMGQGNKKLWITEFGFPTQYNGPPANLAAVPYVSYSMQKDLIEAMFNKIKAKRVDLNVPHLFYYNIQDGPSPQSWMEAAGLRKERGGNKAGWRGYATQAGGNPDWPNNTQHTRRPAINVKPRQSTLVSSLNTDGSGVSVHFQYWTPDPNPVVHNSPSALIEGFEGAQDVERTVSELSPSTDYVFHSVAENENEIVTVGENEEFETPPSTETTANVKRVLHGQPGWASISGRVKEGALNQNGPGIGPVNVNVNFRKDGQFVKSVTAVTDSSGNYETGYVGLGKGTWDARAVFPGGGPWNESASDYREFKVRDGVQITAKHSGKCLNVNTGSTATNEPIMHGSCANPLLAQHQVFTLVPEGGTYYHFVARHSGKCIDINGGNAADGTIAMQHECHGGTNQSFNEVWWGESQYAQYAAKHSNKCLDVQAASQEWANIVQWPCSGLDNQAYHLEPVESAPIPTQTSVTVDQALHGSPGMVSVHGHLLAGAYSMQNRIVHMEFDDANSSNWDTSGGDISIPVAADGSYEHRDIGVPPGNWNIRARFAGNDEFAQSISGTHFRTIKRGYHIINRKSSKCLSLSENKNTPGQNFLQWSCSNPPVNGNGQVFSFWPQGDGWYEIRVNGTNRCVDVAGASAADGAALLLWDCAGPSYHNQHWNRLPISGQPGWYALYSRHAGKCADIWGGSENNGAQALQWSCHWGGNQQWDLSGVVDP